MRIRSASDVVDSSIDTLGLLTGEKPDLIRTGIHGVDLVNGGAEEGEVIVLGGTTGVGKSRIMLASVVASGEPCGIVSFEDPERMLGARLLAQFCDISPNRMRRGDVHPDDIPGIEGARDAIRALPPIHMAFPRNATPESLEEGVSGCLAAGARFVWVDYLQRVGGTGQARAAEIGRVVDAFKGPLADAHAAGCLVSQIRRQSDKEIEKNGYKPSIHMLKESGDIENCARAIVLAWKEGPANEVTDVSAQLAKNSNGRPGMFWTYEETPSAMLRLPRPRRAERPADFQLDPF